MEGGVQIEGFENVMANLQKEVLKIKEYTIIGLRMGVAIIRYDMDKTPPLIPVGRTGNLKASWFVSSFKTSKGPGLVMGFSANYAAAVHEMVDAHFQRPNAGAHFLQASVERNREKVLQVIKEHIEIK